MKENEGTEKIKLKFCFLVFFSLLCCVGCVGAFTLVISDDGLRRGEKV